MIGAGLSVRNFLSNNPKLSLKLVIADYCAQKLRAELSTEWAVSILFRPPALLLAWLLQWTPVSPNMVTLAGFLLLPSMAAAAVMLSPLQALAGIVAIACIFQIFDCVDGTLARISGRTSRFGQYSDFASDICYRPLFYGAVGYVLAQHPALAGNRLADFGLPLALAAAWLMTFARLCRIYSELRFPSPAMATEKSSSLIFAFVSGLDGLAPLIAAATFATGQPGLFFAWVLIFAVADVASTQAAILAELRGPQS